jgi:hypothetical protein
MQYVSSIYLYDVYANLGLTYFTTSRFYHAKNYAILFYCI